MAISILSAAIKCKQIAKAMVVKVEHGVGRRGCARDDALEAN
jgi:hypothetical protein